MIHRGSQEAEAGAKQSLVTAVILLSRLWKALLISPQNYSSKRVLKDRTTPRVPSLLILYQYLLNRVWAGTGTMAWEDRHEDLTPATHPRQTPALTPSLGFFGTRPILFYFYFLKEETKVERIH